MNVSCVILTKNEEKNIERCLKSVSWCDEIIIIDDFSTDRTLEIAGKKAKIFKRHLQNDFSSQRNFGMLKAKNIWVFFLDADEVVSSELANEIKTLDEKTEHNGFYIRRKDIIWGKELQYGETGRVKLLRLAKKTAGKWERKVHEYWDVGGDKGELRNPILHFPHQNLREFIRDLDYFSTLHAGENRIEGKKESLLKVIFWPGLKFLDDFILKGGFIDQTQGFVTALMMSFHSFLAWSKIWLTQRK